MQVSDIAFKIGKGILVPAPVQPSDESSLTFITKMIQYGYMPSDELANALSDSDKLTVELLQKSYMPLIKKSVGGHVKHKPLITNYNNSGSSVGNYIKDLIRFLTTGAANSNFSKAQKGYENARYKILNLVTEKDIDDIFPKILQSADSISDFNKEVIKFFIKTGRAYTLPEKIPFKENLCIVAGLFLEHDMWTADLVRSTDDVLRIVTYLSDGDVSLAENTKFKNLPRRHRKALTLALERVIKEEDLVKHSGKWIKLFHSLHVGDYSKKVYAIAKKVRENQKIETFEGKLELAIANEGWINVISLLKSRPGMFARSMGRLLTIDSKTAAPKFDFIEAFKEVVDNVPTRNLTQLWGSLKTRDKNVQKRVVFPKGSVAKAYVLRNHLAKIAPQYLNELISIITASLLKRFAKGDSLGKVYIDPELIECPLPTGMRSANESLKEVARGTRMPIGDSKVLRFFIYWKGRDIDLSASFHNENFKLVSEVTYYRHQDTEGAFFSGDVLNAPNGASEFIDVNINDALEKEKARYLVMNVHVFDGPTFAEHEECFAGWMGRDGVNDGSTYDPKTVQGKIDLRSDTKTSIPVIFDLKERKAIWADVNAQGRPFSNQYNTLPNNVANNKATIEDMCEAFVSLDNKISLYELFELHAKARGEVTKNMAEADTLFELDGSPAGMHKENATIVTPYDILDINSKYVV